MTGDSPKRCLVCDTPDLWRNKEIPPIINGFIVVVGSFLIGIAAYFRLLTMAIMILFFLAFVNKRLYQMMPDELICYRCRARHRKVSIKGRTAYDHKLGEQYCQ